MVHSSFTDDNGSRSHKTGSHNIVGTEHVLLTADFNTGRPGIPLAPQARFGILVTSLLKPLPSKRGARLVALGWWHSVREATSFTTHDVQSSGSPKPDTHTGTEPPVVGTVSTETLSISSKLTTGYTAVDSAYSFGTAQGSSNEHPGSPARTKVKRTRSSRSQYLHSEWGTTADTQHSSPIGSTSVSTVGPQQ